MFILFLKGIGTGLVLSLPFGPIGIYCMEKTLVEGEKEGYISALGMVTVDLIYGVMAFLFINILREDIEKYGPLLTSGVGVFLIVVGVKKFFKNPVAAKIKDKKRSLFQNYITTFFVSMVNISTILVIIGVYTIIDKWIKVSDIWRIKLPTELETKVLSACFFATGIFIGGATLWFLTTYILYHCRKKINTGTLVKITKAAGILILIFGVITLITTIKHLRHNF
ncbi:MAG: LysE family translocator [Fusobacteriaceae bacterium]